MIFLEEIDEEDKQKFSVNFLLAEFEEIKNMERDTEIMDKHIESSYFQTKNFKSKPYYKPISTCLSTFSNYDTDK